MGKKVVKKRTKLDRGLKKAAKPKQREPLWKGPELDGVTQSMLSTFLVCRERFRLKVIEGLGLPDQFNHRIEYGNMWHICEEFYADQQNREECGAWKNKGWQSALADYVRKLCRRYPLSQEQIVHWGEVCNVQFQVYLDYWAKHPDQKTKENIYSEEVFKVEYRLPSGRVVLLRGKWDAVDWIGKGKNRRIYLQENKTKGDIDEDKMRQQLSFDLQTMVYLVALKEDYDEVAGVRYNVVRRPLSGGKHSIRQKQGQSAPEFYAELQERIKDDAGWFFMRWQVEISQQDVDRFKREFLNPILENLCDWYDFVSSSSEVNWGTNPGLHWRTPYGIYNVLAEGGSTEYDAYLMSGNEVGLERKSTLFSELEE